jgi:hypothetical protein
MTDIRTQREAVEALAKWNHSYHAEPGSYPWEMHLPWAADQYFDALKRNVAACWCRSNGVPDETAIVPDAISLTHATIQALVDGAKEGV